MRDVDVDAGRALPALDASEAGPTCYACGRHLTGRRAHALTCSTRCRVARARGAERLELAEVYEGPGECCGVLVWVYRPQVGGGGSLSELTGPGVVQCRSCGRASWGAVVPRGWEARELDELHLAAMAGEVPPDDDEDVYPAAPEALHV